MPREFIKTSEEDIAQVSGAIDGNLTVSGTSILTGLVVASNGLSSGGSILSTTVNTTGNAEIGSLNIDSNEDRKLTVTAGNGDVAQIEMLEFDTERWGGYMSYDGSDNILRLGTVANNIETVALSINRGSDTVNLVGRLVLDKAAGENFNSFTLGGDGMLSHFEGSETYDDVRSSGTTALTSLHSYASATINSSNNITTDILTNMYINGAPSSTGNHSSGETYGLYVKGGARIDDGLTMGGTMRLQNSSSDPSDTVEGAMYYNTADNLAKLYTGSAYQSVPLMTDGTWSVTIGDGSNNFTDSGSQARYRNIGGMYFINVMVKWSSKASAVSSSDIEISLPQDVGGSTPRAIFNLGYVKGLTYTNQLVAYGQSGTDYFKISDLSKTGAAPTVLEVSEFSNSGEVQLDGHFSID